MDDLLYAVACARIRVGGRGFDYERKPFRIYIILNLDQVWSGSAAIRISKVRSDHSCSEIKEKERILKKNKNVNTYELL